MSLSLTIETLEKELKSEDQRFSMSNTRKADLLFCIKRDLDQAEGDISKSISSLESVLLTLASQGCASALRRLTKKTLKSLLIHFKNSKIISTLIDYLKLTQSFKTSPLAKSTCFDIIGFIYSEFSTKLISPPTEEVFESAAKFYKNCDSPLKKIIIKALNNVIKSRPSNLNPLIPEFLKFLLKAATVSEI